MEAASHLSHLHQAGMTALVRIRQSILRLLMILLLRHYGDLPGICGNAASNFACQEV